MITRTEECRHVYETSAGEHESKTGLRFTHWDHQPSGELVICRFGDHMIVGGLSREAVQALHDLLGAALRDWA